MAKSSQFETCDETIHSSDDGMCTDVGLAA